MIMDKASLTQCEIIRIRMDMRFIGRIVGDTINISLATNLYLNYGDE
jgi:hypothetical protein